MKLVSLTPEGKIVLTLKHGKHTYSELKLETGLSDRWLTTKLGELGGEGVVEKEGKWYALKQEKEISLYEFSLYMSSIAHRIANELASLRFVKAVILFGSVAQKKAREDSDLDIIIVVSKSLDNAKKELTPAISNLESHYHITVEPLILTTEDFVDNIDSREGGIVFGIAEGFEVLADKSGEVGRILNNRIKEIKQSHDFLTEERIWLKVR